MALGTIDDSVFPSIAEAIRSVLGMESPMRPSEIIPFIRIMDPFNVPTVCLPIVPVRNCSCPKRLFPTIV